jgi:hypothetical protein
LLSCDTAAGNPGSVTLAGVFHTAGFRFRLDAGDRLFDHWRNELENKPRYVMLFFFHDWQPTFPPTVFYDKFLRV